MRFAKFAITVYEQAAARKRVGVLWNGDFWIAAPFREGWGITPMKALIEAIEANPRATFAWFVVVHALVWTALPTILYPNLPLDIIEGLTYGREWQLGYDKLPPLPWWIIEAARLTIGFDAAYYAIAQLTIVVSFAIVWAMAVPLVGPLGALVAVLIIDGVHYVNYSAAKFNHDVIQLPFWALAGWAYYHALKGGQIRHWIVLGIAIGIAFWAKYFVAVLAVPLALFVLFDRDARKWVNTPGPYLAAAIALAITAPHLWWLVQNDFLPLAYASSRAPEPTRWYHYLSRPGLFALSQFVFMLPSLIIAAAVFWPRPPAGTPDSIDNFDKRVVGVLTFGPFATVIAISLISGRGTIAMWGYPLWLFFGLWAVLVSRNVIDFKRLGLVVSLSIVAFVSIPIAFTINYSILPYFDRRYRSVFYPGSALAEQVTQRFEVATGKPLEYVIATMWDGGNVAHYSKERPRVLIEGKPERAPWIDLADLREKGAAVLWASTDLNTVPRELGPVAAAAKVQEPIVLHYRRGDKDALLRMGWAILWPEK